MRFLRIVLSVVLLAVPVGGSGLVLLHSSLLEVRDVAVEGAERLDREAVRAAVAVAPGTPLGAVELERVRSDVAALPEVARVAVTRQWPNRLSVALTERVAVAAVDDGESGVVLIDASGFGFARESGPPPGVPLLEVPQPRPGDAVTGAALTVVQSLPPELLEQVVTVAADEPEAVRLVLADGSTVDWGGTERPDTKAGVLSALLPTQAAEYDVRAPEVAVTRG